MLPWIFGVLILLNAALFYWGHQREATLEPPPAPVPEARYQIRLLAEMESAGSEQPAEEAAPGEVPETEGVPAPEPVQQGSETSPEPDREGVEGKAGEADRTGEVSGGDGASKPIPGEAEQEPASEAGSGDAPKGLAEAGDLKSTGTGDMRAR